MPDHTNRGVSFRVKLFFAFHPEELLTPRDIASKYGGHANSVRQALSSSVRRGFLDLVRYDGDGSRVAYRAGPKLIEAIKGLGP